MKKYIALIIMLLLAYIANAQYKTTFSGFTDFKFSKGVEIRGEFENWYISFQAENFIIEKQYAFNWGFSVGSFENIDRFDIYYGLRVGFLILDGSKPVYGIEIELDYNIKENVYIGLKCVYDLYLYADELDTPKSKSIIRPMLKIGYKF